MKTNLNTIPNIKPNESTLLEIAGFPHHENVISNFLAFYLDFENNHGFDDLLLRSLYQMISKELEYEYPKSISVEREVYVGGGRIDILIVTEKIVIAVENKIYHILEKNPLKKYQEYVEKIGEGKRKFGVVLSINKEQPKVDFFKNIIYKDFFKRIKENDKSSLLESNDFYPKFLSELITTISRLNHNSKMNHSDIKYLEEHEEDVKKVSILLTEYFADIRTKLNILKENLKVDDYIDYGKLWLDKEIKAKLSGVLYYVLKKIDGVESVELKIRIAPKGWSVEFWKTENLSKETRKKLESYNDTRNRIYNNIHKFIFH